MQPWGSRSASLRRARSAPRGTRSAGCAWVAQPVSRCLPREGIPTLPRVGHGAASGSRTLDLRIASLAGPKSPGITSHRETLACKDFRPPIRHRASARIACLPASLAARVTPRVRCPHSFGCILGELGHDVGVRAEGEAVYEWPNTCIATRAGTPIVSINVAAMCRASCKRASLTPAARSRAFHAERLHQGAGRARVRRPAVDLGGTRARPPPIRCGHARARAKAFLPMPHTDGFAHPCRHVRRCNACLTVGRAESRSTASHGSPRASPCRNPRASATDQRAALRLPFAASSRLRAFGRERLHFVPKRRRCIDQLRDVAGDQDALQRHLPETPAHRRPELMKIFVELVLQVFTSIRRSVMTWSR